MEIEFVSEKRLKELTGYGSAAAQKRWLDERGVKYLVRRNNKPSVLVEHLA